MTDELLMYHNQVKKNLNCPKAMREKFLADAKRMTDDFLAENPDATLDELKSAIGEPDKLAAMFLENVDSKVIEGHRQRKRWAKKIVVVFLVAVFIAVTAFSIYAANYRYNAKPTKESTIIITEE